MSEKGMVLGLNDMIEGQCWKRKVRGGETDQTKTKKRMRDRQGQAYHLRV